MANKKKTSSKRKSFFKLLPPDKAKNTYQSWGAGAGLATGLIAGNAASHHLGKIPYYGERLSRVAQLSTALATPVLVGTGASIGQRFVRKNIVKADRATPDEIINQYGKRQAIGIPAGAVLGTAAMSHSGLQGIARNWLAPKIGGDAYVLSSRNMKIAGGLLGGYAAHRAIDGLMDFHASHAKRRNYQIANIRERNNPTTASKAVDVTRSLIFGGLSGGALGAGTYDYISALRQAKGLNMPSGLTASRAALGGGLLGAGLILAATYKNPIFKVKKRE